MDELERQYLRTTGLILAAEDWSREYSKDPVTHAKLIRNEAKWQLALSKMYKGFANNSDTFVNWWAYSTQVQAAYNVDVIVNDQAIDDTDGTFITVSLEIVNDLQATGAQAGDNLYDIPLGIQGTDAILQQLSKEQVAGLVGKKIDLDGSIVDNPNAAYNITETMRDDIVESIKTSLTLGETTQQATARVQKTIANPYRAQLIAQTESVNAYQQGLAEYARQAGAQFKQWTTAGATDICADNEAQGAIPIDQDFISGDSEPTAHPNCRCGLIYLWSQTEQ